MPQALLFFSSVSYGIGARLCIKAIIRGSARAMCHGRIRNLLLPALCSLMLSPITAGFSQPVPSLEQTFAASLTALPAESLRVSGSFYVPAYSSVSMSQSKLRADFSVTLSIHNTSETRPLVLRRVAYFDTGGKMVENFLKAPVALKPFAAIEVFIAAADVRGGTGANFVVDWAAAGEITEPVIEALMVGGLGSGHYAFISQGRPLKAIVGN